MKVEEYRGFRGVYLVTLEDGSSRLATRNLTPGRNFYGERLIKFGGEEYRIWDPYRSKLAAAILKGIKKVPITSNHKVLYLGAASGTTVSHVSDIVGEGGRVYSVEFASRAIRELINNVSEYRMNVLPIMADARFPDRYMAIVEEVDEIYCDIAQPEQAKILADNAELFLKEGGWIMLAVKARSIDVTKEPGYIYKREAEVLRRRGFKIFDTVHLEPYDKAHAMILAQYSEI